jgi:hypothetical protein
MGRLEDLLDMRELYTERGEIVITFIDEDVPRSVVILDQQRLHQQTCEPRVEG